MYLTSEEFNKISIQDLISQFGGRGRKIVHNSWFIARECSRKGIVQALDLKNINDTETLSVVIGRMGKQKQSMLINAFRKAGYPLAVNGDSVPSPSLCMLIRRVTPS